MRRATIAGIGKILQRVACGRDLIVDEAELARPSSAFPRRRRNRELCFERQAGTGRSVEVAGIDGDFRRRGRRDRGRAGPEIEFQPIRNTVLNQESGLADTVALRVTECPHPPTRGLEPASGTLKARPPTP